MIYPQRLCNYHNHRSIIWCLVRYHHQCQYYHHSILLPNTEEQIPIIKNSMKVVRTILLLLLFARKTISTVIGATINEQRVEEADTNIEEVEASDWSEIRELVSVLRLHLNYSL